MTAHASNSRPESLFASGLEGPHVDAYRERVRAEVRRAILPVFAAAEAECRFPRTAIEQLGATGVFRERWSGGPEGDLGRSVILSEELGRLGAGGTPPGVTIHGEAAISLLRRFGRNAFLQDYEQRALAGTAIGCVASSEDGGGSDIYNTRTVAAREGDGWRIVGEKSYASLGGCADFALLPCRLERAAEKRDRDGLTVVLVPKDGFRVTKRHNPAGARGLETVRLSIDAHVPREAMLGRPGMGMLVMTWGLTYERLATSAMIMGTSSLAIGLATAHLQRRHCSGTPLIERQALRLRLAALASKVSIIRHAIYAIAASGTLSGARRAREVAGVKVNGALLAEEVLSECMHLFGGQGFLEDEAPLARMWRDVRLQRLGGGTDEVMWEMVASGLIPDHDEYERRVSRQGELAPEVKTELVQPSALAVADPGSDGSARAEMTRR